MVIFTLRLVDFETESENWNFLKYGRIGKHPMQPKYLQSKNIMPIKEMLINESQKCDT